MHPAKTAGLRTAIRLLPRQNWRPGTHPSRWTLFLRARPLHAGSKLSQVIELLQRDHGATIDELVAATSRLAHTTQAS
jgi:hypothetical protein